MNTAVRTVPPLLCLGFFGIAAGAEALLPELADYEPVEIWAFADLADEDGVVNCTVGGEKLVAAPFSGAPCFLCRYRLTSRPDASNYLWGDGSAGPVYALAEGKRLLLEDFTFEGAADFSETHPPGGEPPAWREAYPDFSLHTAEVETATWDEWRLEPGREYRFRVTELHGWFEGVAGHTVEWQLACLGPVNERGEDD